MEDVKKIPQPVAIILDGKALAAKRKAEYEQACKEGGELLASGSFKSAELKFEKALFSSPAGKEGFFALARSYFENGGQQLSVTVVSPEELLDAKVHPENHRDLIVRVGGYSDYFVNLTTELQDNVIERSFVNV